MIRESFDFQDMQLISPQFSGDNPSGDAEEYTTRLFRSIGKFTHAVLGVGEDGHTASLFPGSDATAKKGPRIVATTVDTLQSTRLTATFDLLAMIDTLYLCVTGEKKKEIVGHILNGGANYPIQRLIALRERTIMISDQL